ncbi:thioredoxin-dependent thiol peroxidase [Candidatus Woesebacteria bacterium]|jgi:peroxiredoxin Q/BCP|nr:thioredoxin-dependent thiol peroxidase [Candidatus Woesebacteria bacterium]
MKAPDFSLQDQDGNVHSLADYAGSWLVIYFYPKDDTPGCTQEACNFRDSYTILLDKNVKVLGISKDSVKSHEKFSKKFTLPFPLLSDPDHSTLEAFGAWGEKKFMGKIFNGILRKTYIIDPHGEIVKTYETVKPAEHIQEVLQDIEQLQ